MLHAKQRMLASAQSRLAAQGLVSRHTARVGVQKLPASQRHVLARHNNTQTLAPVTGGEVLSSLVGSPILRLNGSGGRVVPLLLPQNHTLPFAVALHMSDSNDKLQQASKTAPPHSNNISSSSGSSSSGSINSSSSSSNSSSSSSSNNSSNSSPHEALLELHYVLSGTGHLVLSNGEEQPLVPGDSVIVVQGSAQLLAGPAASDKPQQPQQAQQGQQDLDAVPLVTLQVLLPAALLTDTASSLDGTFRPRAATGAEQWLAGQPEGRVTPLLARQAMGGLRPKESSSGLWPGQLWQRLQRQLQGSWPEARELPSAAASEGAAERALDAMMESRSAAGSTSDGLRHESALDAAGSSRQLRSEGNSNESAEASSSGTSKAADVAVLSSRRSSSSSSSSSANHVEASMHSREFMNGNRSGEEPAVTSSTTGSSSSGSSGSSTRPMVHRRALHEAGAFKLPNQSNRLALLFGPDNSGLSLSFGLEIFEPGHRTPPHTHQAAHELFFVLAGEGQGFAGDNRFLLRAGDCAVFPPGVVHGIDNLPADGVSESSSSSGGSSKGGRLYCLQLMTPNEAFVEFVHSGESAGSLDAQDLCTIMPSMSFC